MKVSAARKTAKTDKVTQVFLSQAEVAARIGVGPRSLSRIVLPVEDAKIGPYRGWLPQTIDNWMANERPGRGRWGARGPLS